MTTFAQDGGELSREQWLSPWPRSKKKNEYVRAFGATYTLISKELPGGAYGLRLTVVGPGGVRFDRDFGTDFSEDVKEWLWPDGIGEAPLSLEELFDVQ